MREARKAARVKTKSAGKPRARVTARKQKPSRQRAGGVLRSSEAQFRAFIENAPVAIGISRDGKTFYANSRFLKMFGYADTRELYGHSLLEQVAPSARGEIIERVRRRARGEPAPLEYETIGLRRDGAEFPFAVGVSNIRVPDGEVTIGFFTDITERRQVEQALRESEQRFRSFVEQSTEGFALIDEHGAVVEWNPAQEKMTGLLRDRIVGSPFWQVLQEMLPPAERTPERYERNQRTILDALRTGQSFIFGQTREAEGVGPGGERRVFQQAVFPIKTNRGYRIGSVSRDITERKRAEEEVRASQEKYRLLVENATVGIIVAQDGLVKYANPEALGFAGFSPEELASKPFLELIHPDDQEVTFEYYLQFLRGEETPPSHEFRIIDKHGQTKWLESNAVLVTWEGSPATLNFLQDVTQRRHAEAERQRHVEQMTALNEVALAVQQHLDTDKLYQAACVELRRFGAAASVFHITDDNQLRHVYTSMEDELLADYVRHFDGPIDFALPVSALPDGRMPTGVNVLDAETLREVLKAASLDQHPLVDWLLRYIQNARMLVAPLTQNDEAVGVLTVVGDALNEIDEPAVALFARQMSSALEHAQLFTAESQRRAELDALLALSTELREAQGADEVLGRALRRAMQTLRAEAGFVGFYRSDEGNFKITLAEGLVEPSAGLTFGIEGGIGSVVFRGRQPYSTPDYQSDPNRLNLGSSGQVGPAIFVPLQSEVEILGVLMVARQRAPDANPFSPSEVHLLSTIGEMIGNTLRRARLFDDAQRRLEQTQALHSIDMVITSSLDLRLTLSVFLDETTTRLHVDAADILLRNPHLQTLEYAAGRGFQSNALKQTRLRLGEGIAGRVALERQIISIRDLAKEPSSLTRAPLLATEKFVSYIGVPLIAKGDIQGVLEIFHRTRIEPDEEWLEFLNALATQAAIAIDSAMLYSDLQRSNTELMLAYDATIQGWSQALDLRDRETHGQTERVAEMTVRLARAVGIAEPAIVHIRRGALLHDIGKMGVPDAILLKPTRLINSEWQKMRRHPVIGEQILAPVTLERFDPGEMAGDFGRSRIFLAHKP